MVRFCTPLVVVGAALPFLGPVTSLGWLATVAALVWLDLWLRKRAALGRTDHVRLGLQFAVNVLYGAMAIMLIETGQSIAEVFATTLTGLTVFAILIRDFRSGSRLILNLCPMMATVALVQVGAVMQVVRHGRPELIPAIVGTPVLVALMLLALRQDLLHSRTRLTNARVAAEAAARAKADFLANMSQEIRTPLSAVIGFGGLLDGMAGLPPVARDHSRRIVSSGQALLAIVNDILDFSRLEAGQVELDPQPTDVRRFLEDTLSMFAPEASAKGLTLSLDVDALPAGPVLLDTARVGQVLTNLIGNALKFTPAGSVSVRASWDAIERLSVSVADSGEGIAPDKLPRLFQRFSQVDSSVSRRHGGAGLGLSICKGLVELMGGEIGLSSEPGRGSTFSFSVPAPEAPAQAAVAEASTELQATPSVDILVTDDLEANRVLTRALLEALGHRVTLAASGDEALSLTRGRGFDLIFMDLQMPGMDGFETARRIRAGELNREAPILALSANVLEEHVDASYAAGMNDHLAKPIRPEALVEAIARWSAAQATPEAVSAAARASGSAFGDPRPAFVGRGPENPLRHQRGLAIAAALEHLRPDLVDARVVGRSLGRQLGQVAGDATVLRRQLQRPFRQPPRPAGERRHFRGQRLVLRRLQVRGVAIVPAAVEPPDIANDELGLVVHRLEVGLVEHTGRDLHGMDDLVQPGAGVHQRHRIRHQPLQRVGDLGQNTTDAVLAAYGEAVRRQEQLGIHRGHVAERPRPLERIALHLLRITGVRKVPDEEVARTDRLPLRNPRPGMVVGFTLGVPEFDLEPADLHRHPVGIGQVGLGR